jgi:hypothetical protein
MDTLEYYADISDMYPHGLALQVQAYQEKMSTFTLQGMAPPPPENDIKTQGIYSILCHAQLAGTLEDLYYEADQLLAHNSQKWGDIK